MSAATAEPTDDRMLRLANELAELVRQSPRPEATWGEFVGLMANVHRLDARQVQPVGEASGRPTDPQSRAYMDRVRAEFTRADAEAFARDIETARQTPGAIIWDDEVDILAELEDIQRRHEAGGENS